MRKLQDQIRNSGWRIQNIPWHPEGKVEVLRPRDPYSAVLMIIGLIGFIGGIPLTQNSLSWGLVSMVSGLLLLLVSVFVMGFFYYRTFKPVAARCIDREIRAIEDFDSERIPKSKTFWFARIVCEFEYEGKTFTVTPVIAPGKYYTRENQLMKYLHTCIGDDDLCRLWINPKNPLQAVLHKRPMTVKHT